MTPTSALTVQPDSDGVLHVVGEVDLRTCDELEVAVRAALDQGAPTVVLDLSAMNFCDSTGVGIFVRLHKHAESVGARMVLRSPPTRFSSTLHVTGTDRLLNLQ